MNRTVVNVSGLQQGPLNVHPGGIKNSAERLEVDSGFMFDSDQGLEGQQELAWNALLSKQFELTLESILFRNTTVADSSGSLHIEHSVKPQPRVGLPSLLNRQLELNDQTAAVLLAVAGTS